MQFFLLFLDTDNFLVNVAVHKNEATDRNVHRPTTLTITDTDALLMVMSVDFRV